MVFANGTFLAALLPLLGLPLLVHLLNRAFPEVLRFPDLTHVRKTVAQRSKLYTYRHLILLIIRTVFIALLLVGFLKPFWQRYGARARKQSPRQVVILVDHSLSMEYEAYGVSPRGRAIREATRILNGLAEDDLANILLIEDAARPLFISPTSHRHAELRALLQNVGPGCAQANFSAANRAAAEQLASDSTTIEIYYISDFQRSNWADVDFTALPKGARCLYIDVGQPGAGNRGIMDAAFTRGQLHAGDTAVLDVTVGNFSDDPFEGPVTAIFNDQLKLIENASLAPWAVGSVRFSLGLKEPGLQRCEIQLPGDRLKGDDRHYLVAHVLDREPILLVSDAEDGSRAPAFFLGAALNPYEEQESRSALAPVLSTSAELTPGRLAEARKLLLSEINPLSPITCSRLAEFVFGGGAVIYFLDGNHDLDNLAAMKDAFGEIPLVLHGKRSLEQVADGGQQIGRGTFRSPHLQLFRGSLRRSLGLLEFYDFYIASHTGSGEVLLHYTDGVPAMASLQHGLGTLLLMNFSVSELSSNLARQRIFPAWMHELVESLSTVEPAPMSSIVGQRVYDEVWKDALHPEGVRTPDGSRLAMSPERRGARYGISFLPEVPGFHTLGQPRLAYAWGVNPPSQETDLRQVDRERLAAASDGGTQGHFVAEREDYQHVAWGVPVAHLFLLSAIGCLVLEMLIQRLAARPGGAS